MKQYTKGGTRAVRIIVYVCMGIFCAMTLIPVWIMLVNATRSNAEINQSISFLPSNHLAENWAVLTSSKAMPLNALLNSVIVSTCAPLLAVYSSAMMAYSLVVYKYRLRNAFLTITLVILMVPTQVMIVGYYKMMLGLRLTDTLIALIAPSLASVGCVYFIRQYMSAMIVYEIVESGRIDGANEFHIFNRIMLPLMYPALATQLIFSVVGSWNDYYIPSLIIGSQQKRTLTLMIISLTRQQYASDLGAKYVGVAFCILPMLIIYFALSRYIIDGIALGSVKG